MAVTYMQGSTGNSDYIVVGEFQGLKVGVKPLLNLIPNPVSGNLATLCGCRMRVVPTIQTPSLGHKVKELIPDINFMKVDSIRASVVFAAILPPVPPDMPYADYEEGITEGGLVSKLIDSISPVYELIDNPEIEKQLLQEEILKTYKGLYADMVNDIKSILISHEPDKVVSPSDSVDGGKILEFKKPTED
jgi:hypothetical protein